MYYVYYTYRCSIPITVLTSRYLLFLWGVHIIHKMGYQQWVSSFSAKIINIKLILLIYFNMRYYYYYLEIIIDFTVVHTHCDGWAARWFMNLWNRYQSMHSCLISDRKKLKKYNTWHKIRGNWNVRNHKRTTKHDSVVRGL